MQNLLNINPTSVGKTVVLENDATTGFLSFRLQAAYARPHYRAAYTKAAAEKEWNEIKASLHPYYNEENTTFICGNNSKNKYITNLLSKVK